MTWEQLSLFTDEELGIKKEEKMTHDELLAKIESFNKVTTEGMERRALRAVVELHKPFMGNTLELCKECSHLRQINDPVITYPCPTIQAIEKELG